MFNRIDHLLAVADDALRTLSSASPAARPTPRATHEQPALDQTERDESVRLMRVNHAGEISAQALYSAQALFARDERVRELLSQAAEEERDHLAWCRERIEALGGRTSLLDPLFYAGSFAIGAASALAGDRVSLGFLTETEEQVEAHLDDHLARLPAADHASRAVLEQMKADEHRHAQSGRDAGGQSLPVPLPSVMRLVSRFMTRTSYWV